MQRRGWKRIGSGPLFVDRLFINTDADADDNDDDADADADDSDDNADDDKTLSDYISSRRTPKNNNYSFDNFDIVVQWFEHMW